MGKRSKNRIGLGATLEDPINRDDENTNIKISDLRSTNKTVSHRSKKVKIHLVPDTPVATVDADDSDLHLKAKIGKKSKKGKALNISEDISHHEQVGSNITNAEHLTKDMKKKSSKKKVQEVILPQNDKPKKIVFVDDQPQEVVPETLKKNKVEKKKNRQSLNEEDAAVKDEEIDQFCDELSEQDNEQFESWVQLIEAKLHNKNT